MVRSRMADQAARTIAGEGDFGIEATEVFATHIQREAEPGELGIGLMDLADQPGTLADEFVE
jgi:hypothetical protein